ncbi:conserved hypothetical integral membrane protein TIGR02206 [Planifilum fulgidum]|uniref:Conserved hypothetical integral membrane protein TIGR02206 n=1 Tax=Planifilum fulgidum TaxID=201973 RepID=A0A1I2SSS4_9BACL|nr:TIGR02206 family membrane protein [Planifilum fulgidum]SFG55728.1 conserved hypothetical integral membrane protein TIGR02206 [Planifilum fulgidum]
MFRRFFAGEDDPLLVQSGSPGLFTLQHLMVVLLLLATVCLALHRIRQQAFRTRFLWTLCAFASLVVLDVARMIWEARTGQFDLKEGLPLQLCGIQMFAIPLALFSRGRIGDYMREFVFAYGTVGFLLALLLPIPALQIYPVFHFRSMQSMLYHTALGFVALMLPHLNYRPDIRNVRKAYAVLVACALFTGAVNMLFGSNYLYTSALPIPFDLLPWPLYLPFLLAFALLVGRLPYYAHHSFRSIRRAGTGAPQRRESISKR